MEYTVLIEDKNNRIVSRQTYPSRGRAAQAVATNTGAFVNRDRAARTYYVKLRA